MTSPSSGRGKSWREKLAGYPKLPEVKAIPERIQPRHGPGTIGCTVTTAIFASMAAKAAEEDRQAGGEKITPYWRTLKVNGELNLKYPGGLEELMRRLESEGHTVVQRGQRYFVEDFEKKLVGR